MGAEAAEGVLRSPVEEESKEAQEKAWKDDAEIQVDVISMDVKSLLGWESSYVSRLVFYVASVVLGQLHRGGYVRQDTRQGIDDPWVWEGVEAIDKVQEVGGKGRWWGVDVAARRWRRSARDDSQELRADLWKPFDKTCGLGEGRRR
ncbi:hypothetical protein GUJ93_ZPchr0012g22074 [Zizania palustris]|uniref:Uncharacterized protein n=1 Tax=Zizania palustris TaxID=103762 RepID=A0A8J5WTM6_ZIZPA|nr:hypothetical protein GUJ93_ZPchr0012g22074 [Zizania palustris]